MFKMTFENMRHEKRDGLGNQHITVDVLLDGKKVSDYSWNPFWYGAENDFLKIAEKKKRKHTLMAFVGFSYERDAKSHLDLFQGKVWGKSLYKEDEDKLIDFLLRNDLVPMPKKKDVLYCLLSEADSFMNSSNFEDFCANLGYDTDSRKAENIFNACGRIFLELNSRLGIKKLSKLIERAQNYW